jgi:hypothetical protein
MPTELLRRGIRDHSHALAGWCVGVAAYVALVAAIFPSIKGSQEFNDLVQRYPDALKSLFGLSGGGDFTSGSGFLDAELFSLVLPLLALVFAIRVRGADARRRRGCRSPRARVRVPGSAARRRSHKELGCGGRGRRVLRGRLRRSPC